MNMQLAIWLLPMNVQAAVLRLLFQKMLLEFWNICPRTFFLTHTSSEAMNLVDCASGLLRFVDFISSGEKVQAPAIR